MHLAKDAYWQLLLHMNSGVSEIDDSSFFFSANGARDAEAELNATLDAFFSDEIKDDNSSICRFPARYAWFEEKLDAYDLPTASCPEYDKIFNRVDPKSVTFVFPSAHINSPASMFGHTFLRINSSYNSKLLSYAINYAANANMDTENGVIFAIKGLFGGYYGKYSLLPYYEKLKEYRDSEQRDIWEYDLNLTQEETVRMFRHIWELNGTYSYYYFFTENCSYNMLWFLEAARPKLQLRNKFLYQVTPLETVHVANEQGLIESTHYRPSKRTTLLKYEDLLNEKGIETIIKVMDNNTSVNLMLEAKNISLEQKRYLLEAGVEYLEYEYSRGKIQKERYLWLFHRLTSERSKLGITKDIKIKTPPNPLESHQALRVTLGGGVRDNEAIGYLGFRVAYHDLEDSNYGFLRGTQIEFGDILLSQQKDTTRLEKATIISIVSLAQRSAFFKSFSWRTKIGWDRNSLSEDAAFYGGVGAGYSWGNKLAYIYFLADPFFYVDKSFHTGVGGSVGFSIDKYEFMNTNFEFTQRIYDTSDTQALLKLSQGFRVSQNFQIMLKYDYKQRVQANTKNDESSLGLMLKYYY
ncbi:DUF4105 domain-containing protein [Sulfurimonas sp. SAG-AH-194-L11]|nr:DUF4105 domain-containing protein [Sulfurimonas sp. SAG-AH-194-L11]